MKTILTLLIATSTFIYGVRASAQDENVAAKVQPSDQPLGAEASFFYDQLAPYGQWSWLDPYGWVWTPNNVDAGWRPYTDGDWIYTDCGWTWESDVEWGWAPFHYGRWFFHGNRGWCWVPGSEWAPAWVAWHWGDNWCGWAPLPPLVAWETAPDWDAIIPSFGWCFLAQTDFRRPHLRNHLVLAARNVTLLRETKNVTRFELRNKALVNVSITAEQVEKATGRPVRRFKIAEINSPGGTRVSLNGKAEINIYRPVVKETKMVTPVRGLVANPANPAVTFDQLRRDEAAHRALEAQQARERETLERLHQSELRTPRRGLSASALMERQQAEHRAFNEHVNRQNQVFEHRRQLPPPPVPQESMPTTSAQRSSGGFGKTR
jgi:hypothetical protein